LSGGWAKYALERYEKLKMWRNYALIIARSCREVLREGCSKVYVVGGAARGVLTVLSDIDVVIVVEKEEDKGVDIWLKIKRRAEELGLPLDIPIDLKIYTVAELRRLRETGIVSEDEMVEVTITPPI